MCVRGTVSLLPTHAERRNTVCIRCKSPKTRYRIQLHYFILNIIREPENLRKFHSICFDSTFVCLYVCEYEAECVSGAASLYLCVLFSWFPAFDMSISGRTCTMHKHGHTRNKNKRRSLAATTAARRRIRAKVVETNRKKSEKDGKNCERRKNLVPDKRRKSQVQLALWVA